VTVTELKARVYDLLSQKQAVEMEIQKVNNQIIEALQQKPEEKKAE